MSDNFHFDLTGVPIELCLQVAFGKYRKAVGWSVEPRQDKDKAPPSAVWGARGPAQRLVLYWVAYDGMTLLPAQIKNKPLCRAASTPNGRRRRFILVLSGLYRPTYGFTILAEGNL